MSSKMKTMGELRERLAEKAAEDEEFRDRLLADPKAAIGDELGVALPESLSIVVHEESTATVHLILPPGGNLSEGELGKVAGGYDPLHDVSSRPDQQRGFHNLDW